MTWTTRLLGTEGVDLDVIEETAIALAQSSIESARLKAGLSRADLARAMGRSASYITRILKGDHNLTVRTLARALGACGVDLEFQAVPLTWAWIDTPRPVDDAHDLRDDVETLQDEGACDALPLAA